MITKEHMNVTNVDQITKTTIFVK